MRTVVLGPRPPELEALLERRHALGQDLYDEVWDGEYHMAPAPHSSHGLLDYEVAAILRPLARRAGLIGSGPFNLGSPDNYRVPDRGLHRGSPTTTFGQTAAVVVEIASPDDETRNKIEFYAAHLVDELLIVDPRKRSVIWLVLGTDGYTEQDSTRLLGVSSFDLAAQVDWPAVS